MASTTGYTATLAAIDAALVALHRYAQIVEQGTALLRDWQAGEDLEHEETALATERDRLEAAVKDAVDDAQRHAVALAVAQRRRALEDGRPEVIRAMREEQREARRRWARVATLYEATRSMLAGAGD